MAATLAIDVMQDPMAVTLARVITSANKRATVDGVNVVDSIVTITQIAGAEMLWRVNYGPKDYISCRGGDLIIDVRASDATIKKVMRGQ